MKKTALLSLLLLPFFTLAQDGKVSLEFYGQPSLTDFSESTNNNSQPTGFEADVKPLFAVHGGLQTLVRLGQSNVHLLLGGRLSYYGSTLKFDQDDIIIFDPNDPILIGTFESKFKSEHYYLEFPIGVRIEFPVEKLKVFIQPSLSPAAYLSSRSVQESNFQGNESKSIVNERIENFKSMNLVAALGGGLELPISTHFSILLQPELRFQMLDMLEENFGNDPGRMYAFGMAVGGKVKL